MAIRLNEFGKHHCSMHRSGWPFVHAEFAQHCVDDVAAPFLDDFAEASHVYVKGAPITCNHVAIVHHPAKIVSPLKRDVKHTPKRSLGFKQSWLHSLARLKGVIALSDELATYCKQWLKKDVLSLWHPTDMDVQTWSYYAWCSNQRRVHQLGFFLRDTRAAFRTTAPDDWQLSRSSPSHIPWAKQRDLRLLQLNGKSEHARNVVEVPRLNADEYDSLLASSVITSWIYGASANNVVVECIARATPIVINPLPPIVQYLGNGYPLYCKYPEAAHEVLTKDNVQRAHYWLLSRRDAMRDKLDVKQFVKTCIQYTEQRCK